MFRIEFLVDDDNLAFIMKTIAGRSYNFNAEPVEGLGQRVFKKPATNRGPRKHGEASAGDLITEYLKAQVAAGNSVLKFHDMSSALNQFALSTLYGRLAAFTAQGILTHSGEKGIYNINAEKLGA